MIISNIAVECNGIAADVIALPWTSWATVGRTYCTRWRWKRTWFVMLWYGNFQRCVYHTRVFNGFCCFCWHFERMIDVALKQYANISAWKSKCATEMKIIYEIIGPQ